MTTKRVNGKFTKKVRLYKDPFLDKVFKVQMESLLSGYLKYLNGER